MHARLRVAGRIAGLCTVLAVVSACARQPNLQSIVYREFGPRAIVLSPQSSPPGPSSPEYKQNDYSYAPGALAGPGRIERERDLARGLAEVWNTFPPKYCPHRFVRLDQANVQNEKDVVDDYILDAVWPLDFTAWLNRKAVRETYGNLSEGEIGKLKRVTITLKNVKSYSLDDAALDAAYRQMSPKCVNALRSLPRSVQVAKLLIANISIRTQSARGFRLALGPFEAHQVNRSTFAASSNYLMFAIIPR
ncbi:hypothetical protein [Bradyrhizobium sp. SZCCHNRI3042]|uniref:hypothetical protein n=1 Tax=Bradyrhizobium sp. SZCCHNRI3042 TaxID=3057291 RepID=UPI002915D2CB|nr:hypothetical protein [Bradyrhizobium sp. SZCCHNRI3042]